MTNIIVKKAKLNNSSLKHIVQNNFYFANHNDTLSYDYDFFEIKDKNYILGYIIKYIVLLDNSNTEYIDIYILTNFRSKGIGSKALEYYINNISKKDTIAIKTSKEDKIRFLLKNNFKHDDVYIYKNLYKYKRNDNNE